MIFTETKLKGAFIIDLERRERRPRLLRARLLPARVRGARPEADDRAGQHRLQRERRERYAACTSSFRRRPRPSWCAARAARSSTSSSTCGPRARPTCEHVSVELSEDNHRALYVPERFAHGYQALVDDTETSYSGRRVLHAGDGRRPALRRSAARPDLAAARSRDSPTRIAQWAPLRRASKSSFDSRMALAGIGGPRDHRRHRAEGAGGARAARSASAWSAPASWARG